MTEEPNVQRLLSSSDARVWAEEFAKVCPDVDQGLMVTWFANAMVTATALDAAPPPTPDALGPTFWLDMLGFLVGLVTITVILILLVTS